MTYNCQASVCSKCTVQRSETAAWKSKACGEAGIAVKSKAGLMKSHSAALSHVQFVPLEARSSRVRLRIGSCRRSPLKVLESVEHGAKGPESTGSNG